MKLKRTIDEYGEVIDVNDLCELLNIGKNTAYKLLQHKEIQYFKIGKAIKIPRQCFNNYINKQIAITAIHTTTEGDVTQ